MPDIFHDFPIRSSRTAVFSAMTTPLGLDQWWTLESAGSSHAGSEYALGFGPGYDWRARVTRCEADSAFELEMTRADADWMGTRVGFQLESRGDSTWVRFYHSGWPLQNEHYRISCCCWAMYLRVLRRYLEHGELVPYEQRLDI